MLVLCNTAFYLRSWSLSTVFFSLYVKGKWIKNYCSRVFSGWPSRAAIESTTTWCVQTTQPEHKQKEIEESAGGVAGMSMSATDYMFYQSAADSLLFCCCAGRDGRARRDRRTDEKKWAQTSFFFVWRFPTDEDKRIRSGMMQQLGIFGLHLSWGGTTRSTLTTFFCVKIGLNIDSCSWRSSNSKQGESWMWKKSHIKIAKLTLFPFFFFCQDCMFLNFFSCKPFWKF